jgi:hypothetical protein
MLKSWSLRQHGRTCERKKRYVEDANENNGLGKEGAEEPLPLSIFV